MADYGPRIRAVLFDLGGTLVDERDYAGWTEVARRFLLDFDPDDLAHSFMEVEREFDAEPRRFGLDAALLEFWRRTLSRAAQKDVSVSIAEKFLAAFKESPSPVQLFSDTRRCLDQLRKEHRALGVVSNSTSEARVRQILHEVGILEYFERVVSSGTEGVEKPDPEIFHRAVRRMGLRADEALYVGNLAYTDAKAAKAAGLHALWLNREGFGYGDDPPEITSLLEVPLHVRRIEQGAKGPRTRTAHGRP
jgi:putative hydrolase of the HAD superfamily